MSLEVEGPAPPGDRSESRAAAKPLDNPSLVPADPRDDLAKHVDGTFVLVVKVTGGKYRRRCFLSVASAERAARRALDAGSIAYVYLCELKPLWRLTGGDR
jgi:hypothetical protein